MAGKIAGTELTPIQTRAIIALMENRTIADAAFKSGVNERTLYRWMNDPFFKLQLVEAEAQAMGSATRRLSQGANDALDTLSQIMNDPEMAASIRLAAARTWLEYNFKFRSRSEEVEVRITQLEAQYHGTKNA